MVSRHMTQPNNRVTTKVVNLRDLVQKAAGKDYKKPDPAYQFSNGRKFQSTDDKATGIYQPS